MASGVAWSAGGVVALVARQERVEHAVADVPAVQVLAVDRLVAADPGRADAQRRRPALRDVHHPVGLRERAVHRDIRRRLGPGRQQALGELDLGHADRLQATGEPGQVGHVEVGREAVVTDEPGRQPREPAAAGLGCVAGQQDHGRGELVARVVGSFALAGQHPAADRLHHGAREHERRVHVGDGVVELLLDGGIELHGRAVGDLDQAGGRGQQDKAVVAGVGHDAVLEERAVGVVAVVGGHPGDQARRARADHVGHRGQAGRDPVRVTGKGAGHDRDQRLVGPVRAGLDQAQVVGPQVRIGHEGQHRLEIRGQLVGGERVAEGDQDLQHPVRDADLVGVPVADLAGLLVVFGAVQGVQRGDDPLRLAGFRRQRGAGGGPVDRDGAQPVEHGREEVAARSAGQVRPELGAGDVHGRVVALGDLVECGHGLGAFAGGLVGADLQRPVGGDDLGEVCHGVGRGRRSGVGGGGRQGCGGHCGQCGHGAVAE